MTIEQKILSKLEPHAQRIKDGEGNDFDYLPAVLLQLIQEQKRQAKQLDDTVGLLTSTTSLLESLGAQGQIQIASFEAGALAKMELLGVAIDGVQTRIRDTDNSICQQISSLVSAHAVHTTQTNETLQAIRLQIESLVSSTQRAHVKFMRLLISGLIGSAVMIGLVVAMFQRH